MDISFNCDKCGQHIVIDESGAGITVQCPKCGQSLSVPKAAGFTARSFTKEPLPPARTISRIGKVLGIVGLLFVFLAILFIKTHPKPADQLQKVIRKFAALSAGSVDVDSLEFDVIPSPSGSMVSPYIGTVDYIVPLQVGVLGLFRYKPCRVHVHASFAYQEAEWVFKELDPDVGRANAEYDVYGFLNVRPDPQLSGPPTLIVSPESRDRLEQHRQRWQKATAR